MIDIAAARELVLQSVQPKAAVRRRLLDTPGLVLAEDMCSDIDSPPHDKSLVDGYAVRSGDVTRPGTVLQVLGCVTAGEVPTVAVRQGTAVQIMTGAPLPAGADAVVMVEQTVPERSEDAVRVRLDVERVQAEQNVMRRGSVLRQGASVLRAGHVVRPVDVGLLAEIGCAEVPVIEPPSVAVIATGNELVSACARPQPGQIRNSNGPLLTALAHALQAHVYDLGVAPDQRIALSEAIRRGLCQDVLVLSGGVSAGLVDLVPGVLQELGVQQRFHQVHLKPGKPLWFGESHQAQHRCLVFGLPGNPVGSLVCFSLFVAPALARLGGHVADQLRPKLLVWPQRLSTRVTAPRTIRPRPTGRWTAGRG